MSVKKRRAVFQLCVRLRDIEPAIWRRIHVWEDTRLPQLHRVFQMIFTWEDCHLHDFAVARRVYSIPDPDDDFNERKVIDEKGVLRNRIVGRVGDTFVYACDFGDDGQHDVPPTEIQASGFRSAAANLAAPLPPAGRSAVTSNSDGRLRRKPEAEQFLRLAEDENRVVVDKTA